MNPILTDEQKADLLKSLAFEVVHIGINCENEEEAKKTADMFGAMFGFPIKAGNSSFFASKGIEVMKSPYLGKNGHIAIGTTDVERAKEYLESLGFAFNPDTAKNHADGYLNAIYLRDEVGGFAVHLVRK